MRPQFPSLIRPTGEAEKKAHAGVPTRTHRRSWVLITSALISAAVSTSRGSGTLDASFDAAGGADTSITCLVADSAGRILLGGDFATFAGKPHAGLVRLLADGSTDDSFRAPAFEGEVRAIALQPSDDMILVGGYFAIDGNLSEQNLVRLGRDGARDVRFTLEADFTVHAFAPAAGGDVYVAGDFNVLMRGVTEYPRNYIARFQGNSVESWNRAGIDGFDGPDFSIYAVALQRDGRVVIAGDFSTITAGDADVPRAGIARLRSSDGTNDPTFNPGAGADGTVTCLALLPDGSMLAGGAFSTFATTRHEGLARLRSDGSVDHAFAPQFGTNITVKALALQADGKILVGGDFATVNQRPSAALARLNADGTADPTFTPGEAIEDGSVTGILPLASGQILVVGDFATISGRPRGGIARINGDRAPRLVESPTSQQVTEGATVRFRANALLPSGSGTLHFRWRKDGEALLEGGRIRGVETKELVISSAEWADNGEYTVLVTHEIGAVESFAAELVVETPEPLRIDPTSLAWASGEFRFDLLGDTVHPIVIESTDDLVTWTPLLTNANPTLPFALPASRTKGYFRAKSAP